jgi:predicted AAA+ superfamily ATPase
MIIKRWLKSQLEQYLSGKKVLILYGARQVGKTTLVKEVFESIENAGYFNCDEPDVREAFTHKTSAEMHTFLRGTTTIILDEAQRVRDIGLSLKLLHDTYPQLTIVATGSSSFELANNTHEPLTGRNIPFILYPVSYREYADAIGMMDAQRLLAERLRFGMYPSVITAKDPQQEIKLLAQDYLFRDVFRIDTVRKPIIIEKLVKLLALQIGQPVSYNELAQKLEVSRQTVMTYMRLLEQSFVIFRLPPLGRNKRNEITRFEKIFFVDVGMRNAIIDDFRLPESRTDVGLLFENFFIAERMKQRQRLQNSGSQYFWHTKEGSEVDLVEENHDSLSAFECKWSGASASTRAWRNAYPNTPVTVVHKNNIADILTADS